MRRRTLAVLFAVNLFNIYDRMAPAALLEPIRHEFALSDAQAGLLQTGFIVVYAVAGVPLGWLVDRGNRRGLLAIAVAVWSALTGLGAAATSYGALLTCRLGVGLGEAACAPVAASWIGALFPPDRRSRALAVFMFGVPLGGALSYALGGPAAQAWGWRAAMALAAAPALLLVPAVAALPSPPAMPAAALKKWPRSPALFWIIVSGALLNFGLYAFSTFLPAFMTRVHGLSLARAGLWIGMGYGIAGVAGGAAGGWCGDRWRSGRLLWAAAASLAAAPLAAAGILSGGATSALMLLLGAYALLSSYYALIYAAIQDLVPAESVARTMAVYFLGMYLLGAAFGPWVTGGLSDLLAARALASGAGTELARAVGLRHAMLLIPLVSVAVSAVLYAAATCVRRLPGVRLRSC